VLGLHPPPASGGSSRVIRGRCTRRCRGRGRQEIWLVGGDDLVGQFADHGLLDEILLGIAPVTLGNGAPLLPRGLTASRLELTDVRRDRFAGLTYQVRS
jgi:dihydrofolate reductase